jgi:glucan biosynthesis protein C
MTERYDFLDWLRVIAIFVLLFFHTGMLFVGWGWHITNEETIPALRLPMDIAHRLRMPLLFVIAGAGMWFALKRRSGLGMLGERTLRLFVPLVIGMFLIVPPQIFIERVVSGDWSGGYLDFMVKRVLQFQPYPRGNFAWHHLWFILYLYVYVLLLLPLVLWWRRARIELRPGSWIYALGVPLGINETFLKPLFPENHGLVDDWYTFNHYLMFTAYGVLLASMRGTWDWFANERRRSLVLAIPLTLVGLALLESGVVKRDGVFDGMFATTFTWVWLMVFLGYGRRWLSFSNRLIEWARDASYPVYILHQTVIIVIAYFVIQTAWSPWLKFAVVVSATLAICVLIYELLLRRFVVSRIMFGIKAHVSQHASTAASSKSSALNEAAS